MIPFDFQSPTRIVFGPGKIAELGRRCRQPGSQASARRQRPGHRRGRSCAARHRLAWRPPGSTVTLFDGVEENPTTEHVDAGVAVAARFRAGSDRRPRRRQLDGLRQGNQLSLFVRRPDAGLLGRGQSHRPAVADDRRAHDRRHRQRDAIVRADLRRRDARQNGLRRQEGRVSRRDARSGADGHAAGARHGADGHRCAFARASKPTSPAGAMRSR